VFNVMPCLMMNLMGGGNILLLIHNQLWRGCCYSCFILKHAAAVQGISLSTECKNVVCNIFQLSVKQNTNHRSNANENLPQS